VPTASITQAAASMDLTFIPFGAEEKQALVDEYLFFRPARIPAETYRGQAEPFDGLDVGSMHLITRADADEETVYQATRALWERRESVVEKHPAGRAINENNASRNPGVAFHPGAVRFYREAGIWQDP